MTGSMARTFWTVSLDIPIGFGQKDTIESNSNNKKITYRKKE